MNLTGCGIRFVPFGPDGRVTRAERYNSQSNYYFLLHLQVHNTEDCFERTRHQYHNAGRQGLRELKRRSLHSLSSYNDLFYFEQYLFCAGLVITRSQVTKGITFSM
jgi:hypothetical protein